MFSMADTLLLYIQINTIHCRPCKTYSYKVPHFTCMKRQTSQCSLFSYLWYGDVQYPTICMLIKLFSCCQTLHYMKNGFSVIKRQCIVRSTSDLCHIVMVKAHSQVKEMCSSSYILFCIWLLCHHRPGWCDTVNNYVREQHFIMNTFFHILNPRPFWDIMKYGITSSTINLAPTGRMRYGLSSVQMAGRMFRY